MIALPRPLLERWHALTPREQGTLRLAGVLVALSLLWLILLAPALGTLGQAAARQQELQRQLHTMQRLQAQAQALQNQPRVTPDSQLRALRLSLNALGDSARLEVRGNQAVITLQQQPAAGLAQWLQQLRTQLRMQPTQARLQRHASTSAWDGDLTFTLATAPADAR